MIAPPTAVPAALLALAPADLPTRRPERFLGAGFELPLGRFAPADRDHLRAVYAAVHAVYVARRDMGDAPDYPALAAFLRSVPDGRLLAAARALGEATRAAGRADPGLLKAVHDIRGGALVVLLGSAELLAASPADVDLVRTCVGAARDQAKIIRMLIPEIDPAGRAMDEVIVPHGLDRFTAKWEAAAVGGPAGPVAVAVHADIGGALTACCLESAAVDRVLYNYVNNAARFSPDARVGLWAFPTTPRLVRWVVENRVAADQIEFLTRTAGGDLRGLFAGGVTRGGTGLGLAACADVISECFGLHDPAEAVGRGYLGAKLDGDCFRAWFHWPSLPQVAAPPDEDTQP